MHRFFLLPDCIKDEQVHFPPEQSHQITRVLRMHPGDFLTVLDNLGSEYLVKLEQVNPIDSWGQITGSGPVRGEPVTRLSLYLCLTQREKFEWMLQKCTEVGAGVFIPLITRRALIQGGGEISRKQTRWETIIREAAEQSGRGHLPELRPPLSFEAACQNSSQENILSLIPWEEESRFVEGLALRQALTEISSLPQKAKDFPRIGLMIGGEGGFTREEIALARQYKIVPVSLGPRILRMETAAIVAAALVIDRLG